MHQISLNIFHLPVEEICSIVKHRFPVFCYDFKKHSILLEDEAHNTIGVIRLPLQFILTADLACDSDKAIVLYVSLESGQASVSMMKGNINVYHTTFSAYMTRKKQGFSQVKYLNKKGKSRAGSRVRLAATVDFFEKINTLITELLNDYKVDRIALNCNKTLLPFLYQSKVKCPFDKDDTKLYKIPLHIPKSNFTNLESAIKKLKAPVLTYDEKYSDLMKPFEPVT